MYGKNRVILEKAVTATALSCLFLAATIEAGVVMRTKIYFLRDETRFVRYVGKTIKPLPLRLRGHINETIRGSRNRRCNWIRSMLTKGFTPTIDLITEVEGDGRRAERAYIAFLKKKGIDLVNLTEGGEGCLGYRHTEEDCQKMSDRKKGYIPWNKGRKETKPRSQEYRDICQKAQKKRYEEHPGCPCKEKISDALMGHPVPQKQILKRAATIKAKGGYHHSELTRKNMRHPHKKYKRRLDNAHTLV